MTENSVSEVVVTGPSDGLLDEIGRGLVEARLAACVNVPETPVRSVYWWDGEVQSATEVRAYIHTRAALVDQVVAFIRARHPDDVPGITARALVGGNPEYLRWISEETAPA